MHESYPFREPIRVRWADGTSAVVWMDYADGKAIPVPEALRKAMEPFMEETGEER